MPFRTAVLAAGLAACAGVLATSGVAVADSEANGTAAYSPGVLSGNLVQIPVDLDLNACGNSINVIGLLNPAFGENCVND
ncbi:chaplin [Streptomyces sp. SYSU K217416]